MTKDFPFFILIKVSPLIAIIISINQLSDLPDSFSRLTTLREINISNNRWGFFKGVSQRTLVQLSLILSVSPYQSPLPFSKGKDLWMRLSSVLLAGIRLLESFRFENEDDYEYQIFSILSSAGAWASVIFAGKRDSRRLSATGYSKNRSWWWEQVIKCDFFIILRSGEGLTSFSMEITKATFWVKKKAKRSFPWCLFLFFWRTPA